MFVLVLFALGADAPTLEEGAYLERFLGDLDGAERIYKEVLARGAQGEMRAEVLFRLGALLVRRGQDDGHGFLKMLVDEFPARDDLKKRAFALLDPDRAAIAGDAPRGRVIAVRP